MKRRKDLRTVFLVLALAAALALAGAGLTWAKKPAPAAQAQKDAYQLYQSKCLDCHVSVADPERPGKTRDSWAVVVKFMDKHYVNLSDAEADKLVDLLFALRKGLEKDPG